MKDLDGDGGQEAVGLLAAGTGGTGEMSYLAVVARQEGQVKNIATAPVGDRVQVRDARIDARGIVLDVVQVGKNDAMCCPGDLVTRSWDLQARGLEEGASATTGRLSVEVLAGAEWVLRAWAWDEPAPATPEGTLKLDGGRLAGSAGCNGYFGPNCRLSCPRVSLSCAPPRYPVARSRQPSPRCAAVVPLHRHSGQRP